MQLNAAGMSLHTCPLTTVPEDTYFRLPSSHDNGCHGYNNPRYTTGPQGRNSIAKCRPDRVIVGGKPVAQTLNSFRRSHASSPTTDRVGLASPSSNNLDSNDEFVRFPPNDCDVDGTNCDHLATGTWGNRRPERGGGVVAFAPNLLASSDHQVHIPHVTDNGGLPVGAAGSSNVVRGHSLAGAVAGANARRPNNNNSNNCDRSRDKLIMKGIRLSTV